MEYTAKNLISIAKAEVGYKEKASNSKLDSMTENAGSNNYTKYGRDLAEANFFYGNSKNGYDWCAVFATWVAYKLCGDKEKAKNLLCQSGEGGAGCTTAAQYYRNQNRFFSIPEVGDQIFFGKPGSEYHTGFVETITDSRIGTIEGNASNQVKRCYYDRSNSTIAGYGRPRYEEAAAPEPVAATYLTIGAKGEDVSRLQTMLRSALPDLDLIVDGDFGTQTLNAVKEFQKKSNIEVDGLVGSITFGALEKALATKADEEQKSDFEVGQVVKLKSGAQYYDGGQIPNWVFNSTLYLRSLSGDRAVISTLKSGAVTGAVNINDIECAVAEKENVFKPYQAKVIASALNVREGAGLDCKKVSLLYKNNIITIVAEKNGWGQLTNGNWVSLEFVVKL